VELLYQVPFNSPLVTVPAGQTVAQTIEIWDDATKRFVVGDLSSLTAPPRWMRTTSVRQYSLPRFEDNTLGEPLEGDHPPENVHLKEVEVIVVSYPNPTDPARPGSGGLPGQRILVRTLKPF